MDEMKQKMADQFAMIVQRGMYNDADEMLRDLRKHVNADDYLSEDLCTTAAFLYNKLGDREQELYYLQNGFMINASSPSIFISLADYYSKTNVVQELICLHQAEYLAKKAGVKDQEEFAKTIINAIEKNGVTVPDTSIVILSFNTRDYISQCLDSIKETAPLERTQVIVVDNGSEDGSVEYLRSLDWITLIENGENHGFPGGCNDGINAAEKGNDIWLLNSDTIVPVNALFWLKMGLYESKDTGSCGSITNYAANGQSVNIQANSPEEYVNAGKMLNIPNEYPYAYKPFLIGFSLLIRRTALEKTGLLDERFNPGNSEDVDLGLRMNKEGYLNRLCLNSFIFHYGSRSFNQLQKSAKEYNDLLHVNNEKLVDKLGFNPFEFINGKIELLEEIKADKDASIHVLEAGCGMGAAAAIIRTMYPNAVYVGTEKDERVASYAKAYGEVYCSDLDTLELPEEYNGCFDYIILGDSLQFSADPAALLSKISGYLKKKGRIVISISNIRHYSVILPLLIDGRFSYTQNGIIRKGTRTFFTENEAARLISGNGYSIRDIKPISGDEPTEQEKHYLKSLAELFEQPETDDFTAKEYIYLAEKMQ